MVEAVLEQRRDAVALSAPLDRRSVATEEVIVVCFCLGKMRTPGTGS